MCTPVGGDTSPTPGAAGKQLQVPQPASSHRMGRLPQTGANQPYSLSTLRMGTPPWHPQHRHVWLCPSQWVVPGPCCTGNPRRGWGQPPSTHRRTARVGGDAAPSCKGASREGMRFQREVPRSSFGKGASWEPGLCKDCPRARDGAVLGADAGDFSQPPGGPRGQQCCRGGPHVPMSPWTMPCCEAKGLFPRGVPTQDVPPPCPAEGGQGPGPGAGSEQGGSVCRLAGAGQGQELPRGWEGARAASAPQLGRERCQPHSWGCWATSSVCGRRASARPPPPLPTARPASPVPLGQPSPRVPPAVPQPPSATPRQGHPCGAILPAPHCPCAGVLFPGSTLGHVSLHSQPQRAVPS